MKRILAFLLLLCLSLPFASCGEGKKSDRVSVVCTLFPQYDMARAIAGDCAEVTLLLPPGTEAHSYEPSLANLAAVRRSDLFVYVGGGTDAWAETFVSELDDAGFASLSLLAVCPPVAETLAEGMEAEEEDGNAVEYDEHVWTSPKNAMTIAAALCDALTAVDPAHAEVYRENHAAYQKELAALDAAFAEVRAHAQYDTIVFAERFPFRYLCDCYDIKYYAAFPGCSAASEPSLKTLTFLIGKVKELSLPAVLTIEFSTGAVAARIADACGVKTMELHSCHNVRQAELDAGETYLSLMRKNLEVLREALRG